MFLISSLLQTNHNLDHREEDLIVDDDTAWEILDRLDEGALSPFAAEMSTLLAKAPMNKLVHLEVEGTVDILTMQLLAGKITFLFLGFTFLPFTVFLRQRPQSGDPPRV